jgi:hypothetical protein
MASGSAAGVASPSRLETWGWMGQPPEVGSLWLVLYRGAEVWVQALVLAKGDELDDHMTVLLADGALSMLRPFCLDVLCLWPLESVIEEPWVADSEYVLRFRDDDVSSFVDFYAEEAWKMLGDYDREWLRGGGQYRRVSGKKSEARALADATLPTVLPGSNTPRLRPGHDWFALDTVGSIKKGELCQPDPSDPQFGSYGIFHSSQGPVPMKQLTEAELKVFMKDAPTGELTEEEHEDLRTLPVCYDVQGERFRRFEDAVVLSVETDFADWPISGPRTALFRMKTLRKAGQTPVSQHMSWVEKSKMNKNDRSRHEHEVLSRILETLVCYDQCNVSNLAAVERLVRRQQLIESAYRDGEVPSYDGAEYYMGDEAVAVDGSVICPALRKHATERLKDEYAVAKEKRKAKEEKTLKHPKKEKV